MQRALFWVSAALWLVGAALFVGNVTGWLPTFPYAGALMQIIASIVTTIARGQRLAPAPATEAKTSIITLVFLFALSSAGWLSVAAALSDGSSVVVRLLVSGVFTAVFIAVASNAMRAARQVQNGGSNEV